MSIATAESAEVNLPALSVGSIVGSIRKLLLLRPAAILGAIWWPTLLMAVVVVGALKVYFTLLSDYLRSADLRVASLTMSLLVVALLAWLFLKVLATMRVVRVAFGWPMPGGLAYQGLAPEARLYAGELRYLLVLTALACGAVAVFMQLPASFLMDNVRATGGGLLVLLALFCSIRSAFLGAPIALFERRAIFRRSWELTKRHGGRVVFLWIILTALPGLGVQLVSELVIPWWSGLPRGGFANYAAAADWLAQNDIGLLAIGASITITTMLCSVLMTIGACLTYSTLRET